MKYPLAILCSAALLSGAALAGDKEHDKSGAAKSDTFASLDTNSDGKLSPEEVSGHSSLKESWTNLDSDSDGFVSKKEFKRNTMPKEKASY
jgi:hypothetical protein